MAVAMEVRVGVEVLWALLGRLWRCGGCCRGVECAMKGRGCSALEESGQGEHDGSYGNVIFFYQMQLIIF